LIQNRLSERFLYRFIQERTDWYSKLLHGAPYWCSKGFLDTLFQHRADNKRILANHVEAIRAVMAAMPDDASPLIAIKGFATYALSGDARYIREANAVDLFHEDAAGLYELLQRLGYSGLAGPGHELARVTRGDIKIEIHRYAAVWPCPASVGGMGCPDSSPSRHSGLWVQSVNDPHPKQIGFYELAEHCERSVLPETDRLSVPNATMAAIVKVAHLLHHHFTIPCWHLPGLWMVEYAEIWDLLHDPSFDAPLFRSLVEQFRAHDSVAFAGCLLEWCYGENPFAALFPEIRFPGQDSLLPQRFIYYGPWVAFQTADDLLRNRPPEEIIRQLIPSRVVATTDGTPRRYSLFSEGGERLPRVVVLREHGGHFPAEMAFTWDEDAIVFDVFLPERLANERYYVVEVYHRVKVYRSATIGFDGGFSDHHGDAVPLQCPTGYGARLALPWSELPEAFLTGRCAWLMLTISRREEHPKGNFYDPAMMIPLEIIPE
jgi:hypothetical protein